VVANRYSVTLTRDTFAGSDELWPTAKSHAETFFWFEFDGFENSFRRSDKFAVSKTFRLTKSAFRTAPVLSEELLSCRVEDDCWA